MTGMDRLMCAALVVVALASGPCGATVTERAVRLNTNQTQVAEQPTLTIDGITMPWFDYSGASYVEYQTAIDRCAGAVLYYSHNGVRIFAAHNTSCPPESSFASSLEADEVLVDGQRYMLHSRQTLLALQDFGSVLPISSGVGLQTSTSANRVVISWFVPT